jgi:perosamine synthetase
MRAVLKERNIDTRPVFPAISQYPIWGEQQSPPPNAARIGAQAINLPSGHRLTRDHIDYICRSIKDLLSTHS